MRICILSHVFPRYPGDSATGAGHFVYEFSCRLQERGNAVWVLTPAMSGTEHWGEPLQVIRFGRRHIEKRLGHLRFYSPKDISSLISILEDGKLALMQLAAEEAIDVCLAFWAIPAGFIARQVQEATGLPYVVWALGSDILVFGRHLLFRPLLRKVLSRADGLMADGLDLSRKVSHLARKPCQFVSSVRCNSPRFEGPVIANEATMVFLYVGRLEKIKGIDVLIESIKLILKKSDQFRVHVLGDGLMFTKINRLIAKYRLDKIVRLHGYVSDEVRESYLRCSDYLVIPSRSESIPLVFSEAMHAGLPVVVTDVGDMGALVRHYRVGPVVPPDDPTQLALALEKVIVAGRNGRETYSANTSEVSGKFCIDNVLDTCLAVLQGTLRR
jgi:glycosyltransferase involved in cell wall biosynthesis